MLQRRDLTCLEILIPNAHLVTCLTDLIPMSFLYLDFLLSGCKCIEKVCDGTFRQCYSWTFCTLKGSVWKSNILFLSPCISVVQWYLKGKINLQLSAEVNLRSISPCLGYKNLGKFLYSYQLPCPSGFPAHKDICSFLTWSMLVLPLQSHEITPLF